MMRSLSIVAILLPLTVYSAEPAYDPERLEKEVVAFGLEDGMEMEVLPDGRIVVIERAGGVKRYDPVRHRTTLLGRIPTAVFGEVGLNGLALAPDFDKSGFLYVFYCPSAKTTTMRVSRFTVNGDSLNLDSEKTVLEIRIDGPDAAIHMGGGLAMDAHGHLYIGTGDNSPPIPELPVDQRKGHEHHDAQRTAANTNDLRGKILRIHPEADGTYSIPKGNLFPDGKGGRPEIYCMGCRNPYRLSIDAKTNWLYWGDVGPNVILDIKVGPNGYDEINQARTAGNFGWPMFVGPNEPYSEFDFEKRKVGRRFDPKMPVNRSKNNTGAQNLPPAQPAWLWYPTFESKEWPQLGTGGRSAMSGPVYRYDPALNSPTRLPQEFDQCLFFCEWMRNWLAFARLDENGKPGRVDLFAKHLLFRRPIDMRLGPDGAMYILEYGDKWSGNTDGQITRLVYRRGNRAPIAALESSARAGKHPLTVTLDARGSRDKDPGDRLTYSWTIDGQPRGDSTSTFQATFEKPGIHRALVKVTDAAGASSSATIEIPVGNSPPRVTFQSPVHGGFFDWGQPLSYQVEAEDLEDGSTVKGTMAADRVVVRAEYQVRRRSPDGEAVHPGLALMRKSTCFACHTAEGQSKGPPYHGVAQKYRDQKDARETLAKKVLTGGAGVWGAYPMPPHPQHTLEQTRVMVEWIMSLTAGPTMPPTAGTKSGFLARLDAKGFPTGYPDGGVLVLTASCTDAGAAHMPPLTTESEMVLHARRKRAAWHDFGRGIQVVDDLEDERGMIAWMGQGDYLGFADMNLQGIDRIKIRVRGRAGARGAIEMRSGSPTGPLVARIDVSAGTHREAVVPIQAPSGVHDLYFVAADTSSDRKQLALNWVEFLDSPQVAMSRKSEREEARRLIAGRKPVAKARPFVRNWTIADFDQAVVGKSVERGRTLFTELACVKCHKIGAMGSTVGPDLTDLPARLAKQKEPRLALLTELIEPSKVVDAKYKTSIVVLDNGQTLAGIIVEQNADTIRIAANPAQPDEIRTISRKSIEELRPSEVSLMPTGLLNTLTKEEILDLIAFLESKR